MATRMSQRRKRRRRRKNLAELFRPRTGPDKPPPINYFKFEANLVSFGLCLHRPHVYFYKSESIPSFLIVYSDDLSSDILI